MTDPKTPALLDVLCESRECGDWPMYHVHNRNCPPLPAPAPSAPGTPQLERARLYDAETRGAQGKKGTPPAGARCLGCGVRPATRYAHDHEGCGFAMCDACRLDEEEESHGG